MIKVKIEHDDDNSNNTYSFGTNHDEPEIDNSIQVKIKEENELIIEPDLVWLPSKLKVEQQEYYQQCSDDNDQEGSYILPTIKPENDEFEGYSIEYVDEDEECDDDDEDNSNEMYEYDEYEENDGLNYNDFMDTSNKEISENLEGSEVAAGSGTKTNVCKNTLLKWLCGEYIQHICPICEETFSSYELWCKHIQLQHVDLIEDAKSNYYISIAPNAICRQCNKRFNKDYLLLIHSLRHSTSNVVNFLTCNVCSFKSSKAIFVRDHIMEHHPHIIDVFKTQGIKPIGKTFKCPVCGDVFKTYSQIRLHFKDNHTKEYFEKYRYECYLCPLVIEKYDSDQEFYEHLFEKHNFKDLKQLNFVKFSINSDEEQQHYSCSKCLKIFTELDLKMFLQHYLEHDTHCYWACKTCNKKISFRLRSFFHMCNKLFKTYRNRPRKIKTDEDLPCSSSSAVAAASTSQESKELSNWQEFEEYMLHMCPFCNKEFKTLPKWQMHLRKLHQIDTLKGLEMKAIAEDSNKLECTICNTLVINSSVQLHTHRFQHLPFKPYKCRHCLQTLATYKSASAHVVNKCQNTKDGSLKATLFQEQKNRKQTVRESYEIICPLCKDQTFADEEQLEQHFANEHNNFRDYYTQQSSDNSMICKICQHLFAIYNKTLCLSHILKHFHQKSYNCLKCSISFQTKKTCIKHMYQHYATPLNRREANKESLDNNPLLNSIYLEEDKVRMARCTEKSTTLNEFVEFITYACPECNESLATQQLWHDHVNNKHEFFKVENLSTKDLTNGDHKCKHCHLKISSSIAQRQKHKLTHMPHKPFICALCYHRCNSLGVLYGHLRRRHFTKGSFKCPICSEVLINAHERSEHLKNTHPRTEWPSSMCLICYSTFKTNTQLKHHKLVHDINRPKFECEVCGARIIERKDFKLHMARHNKTTEGTSETSDGQVEIPFYRKRPNEEDNSLVEPSITKNKKRDSNGKFCV